MSKQIYSNFSEYVSNIGMKVGNLYSNDCKRLRVKMKENIFECKNVYFETFVKLFVRYRSIVAKNILLEMWMLNGVNETKIRAF